MIEIISRYTGAVLYRADVSDVRAAVLQAVTANANLSGADLSGARLLQANLSGANLSRAALSGADLSRTSLYGADLSRANLSRTNLYGANLSRTNLSGANLSRANLSWASLSRADLSRTNLYRANLSRTNLYGANLSRTNLSGANLSEVKRDIIAVLDASPHEVHGLRDALAGGRIDGSCYTGECCCLVGTLAALRRVGICELPGRQPDSASPAERWFLAMRPGHTPENSQVAAITLQWIDEWIDTHSAPQSMENVDR